MQTMYPAMINSPQTELAQAIDDTQTTIPLLDASVLPAAPNLATIGTGEDAETILYTGVSGNNLTGVTRGFQGAAKAWNAGTKVARNFTAYDYDALRENLEDHASATTGVHGATSAATPNTIVQRDANGRFKAAPPSASDDVARKADVDAVDSAAMKKVADSDLNMNARSIRNLLTLNLRSAIPLTISNGAITVTQTYHSVDTEGGAPTDDLDTINGGNVGDILILRGVYGTRDVTIRHGVGNIYTWDGQNITLELGSFNFVQLVKMSATQWVVVGVGNPGIKRTGDTMTGRLQINNQLYYGTGSPEGNLAASPGSIYQNLSGGAGTTLYYKASGTGNTGWVAIA